jgi:hypothetical protein
MEKFIFVLIHLKTNKVITEKELTIEEAQERNQELRFFRYELKGGE